MKRIQQLSKHIINQIAAGEVIERPSSVVKELVENSIDAGALKVSVDITNECRNIRVADNGSGIHPDDIMLAFSKHATSKIENSEDLYDIHTLGFRGEALSSIISIAKLSCTTRTKDFDYGTKVVCENSEVKQTQTGCAVGTIMEVKDLFYNIPARLKFLKNSNTEFSYIQELIRAIALANPQCAIELKNNGKTAIKTTGQNNLLQTIKEVYSADVTSHLKEVLKTDKLSSLKISGYVSTPDYTRSSKKYHMYINGRTVKCPVFQKAVDTAYKSLIASGKYPFIVLNLEIPPADVDVNVHPTKKEVRYKNTNQVFNFIYASVIAGLSNYAEKKENTEEEKAETLQSINVLDFYDRKNEITKDIVIDKDDDTVYISDRGMQDLERKIQQNTEQRQIFKFEDAPQDDVFEENIIGQYKNTYILIEKTDGLEIVDQHIAEERYKYEKLLEEKEVVSQILFISDRITVSETDAEIIKENLSKFEKYGYGIEFLSDTDIMFRKVPQIVSKVDPKEILTDILENINNGMTDIEDKILKTTACKASVKAGQKLSTWQMQEIIKNWRTTKMPYTCPHGRPVTHTVPHKEIASFFCRAE